jgi:hypothetical protein
MGKPTSLVACGAIALAASTLGNALLWWVGSAIGRMTVGLPEVLLFSALGVVAGAVLRLAVVRWSKAPATLFVRVCAGVLAVYALGPVSAAIAPYMEGAETFTTVTVITTEAMHLVSVGAILLTLVPSSRSA